MPCVHPLKVWRELSPDEHGKRPVHFRRPGVPFENIDLPCGQCIKCRLLKAQHWSARMDHEAREHDDNCFITLTYDDDHLPYGGTLVKHHLQDFFKRLRKRIAPNKVRYYACGEYGDETDRPHYHAILFGYDFEDAVFVGHRDGYPVYESELLAKVWPFGFHEIGTVTLDSCGYVAGYCLKKVTGVNAYEHYQVIVESTGELYDREPEFGLMSRRPGIGHDHFQKFKSDYYPADEIVFLNRGPVCPPRYYDELLKKADPEQYEAVRCEREKVYAEHFAEGPSLDSRETVALARLNLFKRSTL